MPNDQAREKSTLIAAYGATVEEVPPASIVDVDQYVNLAKRRAIADQHGFFANQFENLSNARAHYATTAPEIWQQTHGKIDAFIAGKQHSITQTQNTKQKISNKTQNRRYQTPLYSLFLSFSAKVKYRHFDYRKRYRWHVGWCFDVSERAKVIYSHATLLAVLFQILLFVFVRFVFCIFAARRL